MGGALFTPVMIGNRQLANRITVAPMCQYSAVDGSMSDWHTMHLGSLAISGAAMLVMEATGVTPGSRPSSSWFCATGPAWPSPVNSRAGLS